MWSKKILLFLFISMLITNVCFSQQQFWKFENEQSVLKLNTPRLITPKIYLVLSLSFDKYKAYLNTAPAESAGSKKGIEISIPYPDNTFKRFRIAQTKMMEDGLAAQFPQIKTYLGQGIDDPSAAIYIDYTAQGFHAYVLSSSGTLFIDPYQKGNNNLYITYFSKDYVNPLKEKYRCSTDEKLSRKADSSSASAPLTGTCIGTQLRTYRIAISSTGEYAAAVCPPGNVTVANTLSAIVTTLNRVNGVYETELDIRMILVAANAGIVYTNPATDPYSGNDDANTLISESQSNITAVIGSSAFDIGHTFSTGAGGLSSLGAVCRSGNKASGVTGLENPTGDVYDIDYVSHEIGHEFGATHTFEGINGNCGDGGSRSKSAAYEVGSGTTIMSYSGICGSDNLQSHSDPYFHTKSFDQIVAYTTTGAGSTCPLVTSTGNNPPVVTMPTSGIKIPKGTPFTLTGIATDGDGDALTYSWEEWDLTNSDNGSEWNSGATSTTAPLFKVRVPKTSASRTFPDIAVILAHYPPDPDTAKGGLKGETLPQVARDIKFRLTVRDNKAGGGGLATGGDGCSSTAPFKIAVTNDGPFTVTSPNTAVNWLGGTAQTVTWNVANTNNASGINAQNVDILMSTDGGKTYPQVIISNVINNGSANITVPNISTDSLVRIMVRASGNIFFDISDVNFTITFNPAVSLTFSAVMRPNPFKNNTDLYLNGIKKTNFEILVSDAIGRVIVRKEIKNSLDTRVVPVSLIAGASGIYFIKFLQDDIERTIKVVKF